MAEIEASDFPHTVVYHKEHTWARADGDLVVVGISDYAQDQLGEIIFIDLPRPGDRFDRDAVFGVVESVKTASDLYMPVGGEIVAVNEQLADRPETLNSDPFGDGWMIKIKVEDAAQMDSMMSAEDYLKMLKA